MERVYQYKNGTVYVTSPESYDREKLKKATEEFLRKVLRGGHKNGNSTTGGTFGKE